MVFKISNLAESNLTLEFGCSVDLIRISKRLPEYVLGTHSLVSRTRRVQKGASPN